MGFSLIVVVACTKVYTGTIVVKSSQVMPSRVESSQVNCSLKDMLDSRRGHDDRHIHERIPFVIAALVNNYKMISFFF